MNKKSMMQLFPNRWDMPIFILVAATLLVVALQMPVLSVKKMWMKDSFSILSGIQQLREDGHLGLAVIIFFFSIVFPVFKLVALLAVWFLKLTDRQRRNALDWLGIVGKWSMLDVYVAALLIVIVKLGAFTKAIPQQGLYVFGGAILLSMVMTTAMLRMAEGSEV